MLNVECRMVKSRMLTAPTPLTLRHKEDEVNRLARRLPRLARAPPSLSASARSRRSLRRRRTQALGFSHLLAGPHPRSHSLGGFAPRSGPASAFSFGEVSPEPSA